MASDFQVVPREYGHLDLVPLTARAVEYVAREYAMHGPDCLSDHPATPFSLFVENRCADDFLTYLREQGYTVEQAS